HRRLPRLLLTHGANVEAKDNLGETPLYHAASHGHEAAVRLLLEYHAKVNARASQTRETTLHQAAQRSHEGIARILVSAGADVTPRNSGGATTLHLAVMGGHDGIARLLL
ncbi:ankyrin repeat protein, partial [Trichophaea hybrida]